MAFYIGIDLGTSAIKVILLDEEQLEHAAISVPLDVLRPHAGWSEQTPDSWWQGVDSALDQLAQTYPEKMASLRAIGLSGQMHGLVALDKDDTVLRNAILWNDTRASAEAEALDNTEPAFRQIGGNMVMAGFTAPKAVWMAHHEADLFVRINTILLPKDYIRFCLSGEKISDMSDASGTSWLDIAERCWSEALLEACGLNIEQMPTLVEGSQVGGYLRPELCRKWGIAQQVVIAGGAGDNAAAAIGLGITQPEQSFVSLGTSGVVFSVTDSFVERADRAVHAFCHALPDSWHQMGVILSATDSLNWLSETLGQPVPELLAQMKPEDSAKSLPLFHPYLGGERTPHNNPDAKGGFFGLSRTDDAGDMARAVLQGVAFAIADARDVLDIAHKPASQMIATGGGANNAYWLTLLASLTNSPVSVPKHADTGAALGAARLGMMADGMQIEQVCYAAEMAQTIYPDAQLSEALSGAREKSRDLYQLTAQLHL